jgi:hypothetical protein
MATATRKVFFNFYRMHVHNLTTYFQQYWFQWPDVEMDSAWGPATLDAADMKRLILEQRRQAKDPAAAEIRLSYQAGDGLKHLKPEENLPSEAGLAHSPLVVHLPGIIMQFPPPPPHTHT